MLGSRRFSLVQAAQGGGDLCAGVVCVCRAEGVLPVVVDEGRQVAQVGFDVVRFEQAAMQVVADIEQAAGQRREAVVHMAVEVVAAFAAAVPFLDRVVEEHQRLAATIACHLAVVFDGGEQRLAVGFCGVEEVVAVFGDDFVVVAEDEVVFAVELMQDAGDAGDVAGEGDVAEVIDGVFRRNGRVPLGNQRRVHFFDGGVGAELRAEFHDVFVREVQV